MSAGTLVDSNVLLDVLTDDQEWFGWSSTALARVIDEGPVIVNPLIFAEVSVRFSRIEDLEAALPDQTFRRVPLPWSGAFLAGKAFARYRQLGGVRHSPLPDFYVGAHAAVAGLALLTRDSSRYRTYFPTVRLIAPG